MTIGNAKKTLEVLLTLWSPFNGQEVNELYVERRLTVTCGFHGVDEFRQPFKKPVVAGA